MMEVGSALAGQTTVVMGEYTGMANKDKQSNK